MNCGTGRACCRVASLHGPRCRFKVGEFVYEPGSMPVGIYFIFGGLAAQVRAPRGSGAAKFVHLHQEKCCAVSFRSKW